MDWSVVDGASDRVRLAQAFVRIVPSAGVNRQTMRLAAKEALGSADGWKKVFDGPTEVLWFVSEVSDASMCAAFVGTPAREMTEVVNVRLDQNGSLKPFVNQVMLYDVLHPIQALARMHRTARAMYDCLGQGSPSAGQPRLTLLNLAYTGLVFRWLIDRSERDRHTKSTTRAVFRLLGL